MKYHLGILCAALLFVAAGPITLWPGMKAPDFTAITTNGTKISLHDYLGKSNVLLYFYPADLSSGCTVEACKFRDEKAKFAESNTVILGVSLDNQDLHKTFTEKENLNFPLLVDTDSVICRAYGVPIRNGKYAARWSFLIGKDGKIVQVYHKVDPTSHGVAVLQDIWDYNNSHK